MAPAAFGNAQGLYDQALAWSTANPLAATVSSPISAAFEHVTLMATHISTRLHSPLAYTGDHRIIGFLGVGYCNEGG